MPDLLNQKKFKNFMTRHLMSGNKAFTIIQVIVN